MRLKKIFIIIHKKHLNTFFLITSLLSLILLFTLSMFNSNKDLEYIDYPDNDYISITSTGTHTPKLAIIIDDFGQNQNGVKEMLKIDRHLTFAVMPFLDYSKQNAINAHEQGYEVIVHLPMQSQTTDIASWLGPRPVKVNLKDDEIKKIVQDSINSIPYAVGMNIHMGALASENERVMSDVMKVAKDKRLYFVDSLTSPRTVCRSVAKKIGIKFAQRDIFLEHSSKSRTYIKKQLTLAGNTALKYGYAVAIGHVGSEGGKVTAEAIKEMIPELERKGIKFAYASELVN